MYIRVCICVCVRACAHLSSTVEAQDLKADAGGSSCLDLVQVPEQVEPCAPSPVVQLPLRQDAQ